MTQFFTSDQHWGHARICELSNRPFSDVSEMNEVLVERWNETVRPEDNVIVCGDWALGKITESLAITSELNGEKTLLLGNHDRPWKHAKHKPGKLEEWRQIYLDAGFNHVMDTLSGAEIGASVKKDAAATAYRGFCTEHGLKITWVF